MQPPTAEQKEWIHAYGMAWVQSDNTLRYDHPRRVPFIRQIGERAVDSFIVELNKTFEEITVVRVPPEKEAQSKKR